MKSSMILPAMLCLTLAVCQGPTGLEDVAESTELEWVQYLARPYGLPPVVVVPDTVSRGTPFTVSIETRGGGCQYEDETEVEVVGNTATISPHNKGPVGDPICTADVRVYVPSATVTFWVRGRGTIVFRVSDTAWAPVEYRYSVWVE